MMDSESPRAGKGARAGKSTAADPSDPSETSPETQRREQFRVVITRGLWRGCDVVVEPPTHTHPLRHCSDHAEAIAVAEAISQMEGWSVQDRVGNG